MDDKEILLTWRSDRREEAFNAIVQQYSEKLYWHVRALTNSHEDTDDLLQDIFVKIWGALPGFRGDSNLYTWIWRIATNETLNFLSRSNRRSTEGLTPEMEGKIDGDPWFNGTAVERELAKAMASLPKKQRLVFQMRYYEEMPYEDISKILKTSVGSLKASYHFAYKKIKEALGNSLDDF